MKAQHFLDSEARSYSRTFPVVFDKAEGSYLYDIDGRRYLDFFCGAGALNYGHNEPRMKRTLIDYIERNGVMQSLDMATRARHAFLDRFDEVVLSPRGYNYRVQFTGPTGANAIEAALKLARRVKRRPGVLAFTRAYHGLSLGALAVTANSYYRDPAFSFPSNATFVPYEGYCGANLDTLGYIRSLLEDSSSGTDLPAAIIVETVQAEGGVNVASMEWLRGLASLCRELDILLIVDDIQVGCGRTGTFFSFEDAGIQPDIVALSKSLSGYGFPMALNLIRPELDAWKPGEHAGTFRGNGAALVTAASALSFWEDAAFVAHLGAAHGILWGGLKSIQSSFPELPIAIRGRGMIFGIDIPVEGFCQSVVQECFSRRLIVEQCGREQSTLKLLPALTVSDAELSEAVDVLAQSIATVYESHVERLSVETVSKV